MKIKLNGKELEVPKGENLLAVCLQEGVYVPHFCYHPGLVSEGNCRMCLVKVSTSRKLEVACMTLCSDGLEVETEDASVVKARHYVLEYMLANHPLDCPVCDKAGECDLQDYVYLHRGGLSRMQDPKVSKPKKDLGPNIRIWSQRCILCSRCVRFLRDEAGTGELGIFNRGDHNEIGVFPGIPIDNPMSLNVVDICPVGALIDKNFLYQARVWFARETESVCPSCSRGCSVRITSLDNRVKRMVPRRNDAVNGWWMCDHGRLHTEYLASEKRLGRRKGSPKALVEKIRGLGEGKVAALVSTWQTIEEMFLFKKLVDALGIRKVGILHAPEGERWESKGGFVIEAERSPNRAFAEALFGKDTSIDAKAKGLLALNGIPDAFWPQGLLDRLSKLEWIGLIDILESPVSEAAHTVLPGAAFAEKEGTFVNRDGRVQRIRPALQLEAFARPEIGILQEALIAAGARDRMSSAEEVFAEAAAEVAMLKGLDYAKIGRLGAKAGGVKV
ncbi:MAG: NADH-quinone oxidoreductase subunit G [Planctomycetota bacterium]